MLEDYDVRGVAQAYICGLKVKSILGPALGDIKAAKLTTERVKGFIHDRLKKVKASTVNRELALLHRAFQLGYQHDPPLVGRVPVFPKLPEGEARKGFLKPQLYQKLVDELPEELRLLFVIAYHVGLRKGALLRIKWSQVDPNASCIWMDGQTGISEAGTRGRANLRRYDKVLGAAAERERIPFRAWRQSN